MPRVDFVTSVPVVRTPRVRQLEGLFDLPPSKRSELRWQVRSAARRAPVEYIGLIVGPSGCGKSTLARALFPDALVGGFAWPDDKAIVDAFPADQSIKDVTQLLSSVGFSSPPAWLRPFRCLSNGEQFRVTIARALAEQPELAVIDEFTSVVDRTVAQIGSAAVAKAVRRRKQRFVAVACHYDVIDWLDPDWIYDPASAEFSWRLERRSRPPICLDVQRVHRSAWQLFHQHHYLDGSLSRTSKCFLATINGRPAAFTAVQSFPHPIAPAWREHRTVCLPDFQGVGIGNALSELVAAVFVADGRGYISTTSNPAMIGHRERSPLWKMHRKPSMVSAPRANSLHRDEKHSFGRITAGFRYVGPPAPPEAVDALLACDRGHGIEAARKIAPLLTGRRGVTTTFLRRRTGFSDAQVRAGLAHLQATGQVIRRGNGGKLDPYSFELAPANQERATSTGTDHIPC